MKKSLLIAALSFSLGSWAQDDITPFYLTNGDFDEKCNYDASRTTNVAGDVINDVYGWTYASDATYTVAGTFEYNGKARFNSSTAIPAAGYDGKEGGGLALSTGWGQTLTYEQEVTLPKGTYRFTTAAYNAGTATAGNLVIRWTPTSGVGVEQTVSNFTAKKWTTGEVEFTLSAQKKATLSISFQAADNTSSANCAKLIVDYVRILALDMDLTTPLANLKSAISAANTQYGDGSKVNADALKKVIDLAQSIYDDAAHTPTQVLTATTLLKETTHQNKLDNATADNPYNVTSLYLTNPSFESKFAGWDNIGMKTQTNTTFSKKAGSTYAEAWVNIGSPIGTLSLMQTLSDIPAGRYRVTAAALAIQQSGSGSTTNKGAAQTGTYLVADKVQTPVTAMKDYSLEFVVLGDNATIGFVCQDATANWVCVDNFRLYYLGAVSETDMVEAVQTQMTFIDNIILPMRMQDAARNAMTEAMTYAQGVVAAPTTAGVERATFLLDSCTAVCEASITLYANLAERIEYAKQVLDWVSNNATKVTKLTKAIATAEEKYDNFALSNTQLKGAVNTLNSTIKSVDKGIYTAQWSMGDVNDPNNAWYIGRTVESKDWVLFWEKGYGDDVPVNYPCGNYKVNAYETLAHAQKAFDFYADSLKFIDRNNSKTNQYKMVIRLRYSETEWEATGSGVDDCIGLLTLTPWAQTSRNWQTVYHECGHCFQYQTHCDNGDWNGWMYKVGPNGTAFWEQCAQWQAYKIMPYDQFTNEWFNGYMSRVHKHILHETPRYENYFIQDYWSMKHGMDIVAKMWDQCRDPEDAVQTYQRITGITNRQFNDEMWDCAARFATWDIPHLQPYHNDTWKNRPQPTLTRDADKYWVISPDFAPENTGHNIIKLNVPTRATQVTACFEGLAGDSRFRDNYAQQAGWRYGFVALKSDGTRLYSTVGDRASYSSPCDTVRFDVPAGCTNLWFVVSGASTSYRMHGWDDDDTNDEQLGYRVRFDSTNLLGQTTDHITAVRDAMNTTTDEPKGIYTLTGVRVRQDNNTQGLPAGLYLVGGKVITVK